MSFPRIARIVSSDAVVSSTPSPSPLRNHTLPAAICPPAWSVSRRIAPAVTDLPEPDSPTIASVLPGCTSKLRSSTARKSPCSVAKSTDRPRTDSSTDGWSLAATGSDGGVKRQVSSSGRHRTVRENRPTRATDQQPAAANSINRDSQKKWLRLQPFFSTLAGVDVRSQGCSGDRAYRTASCQCPLAPEAPMPVSDRTCCARKPALSIAARLLLSVTENNQIPMKPIAIENSAGDV